MSYRTGTCIFPTAPGELLLPLLRISNRIRVDILIMVFVRRIYIHLLGQAQVEGSLIDQQSPLLHFALRILSMGYSRLYTVVITKDKPVASRGSIFALASKIDIPASFSISST